MKLRIAFFFLWMTGLPAGYADAGQVTVKEVSLQLYNKPVTGYRVLIDRNQKLIAAQVIKHITASGGAHPFEYERTIILENAFYKTITDSREISLYFLLRPVDAQYTEVTLVVMYDYKRCINFRDFPVLAIRMMADYSEIIRKISGDELLFDGMVFSPLNMVEIEKKYSNNSLAFQESSEGASFRSEEEVDNPVVSMKTDPFVDAGSEGPNTDSLLKIIGLRRRELELKEKELARREQEMQVQQQEFESNRNQLNRQLNHMGSLKDSISSLNLKLENYRKQMLTGDEVSISSDNRELITQLKNDLDDSRNRYAALKAHSDSSDSRLALLIEKENSAKGKREVMQKRISQLEEQNTLLRDEIKVLKEYNKPQVSQAGDSAGINSAKLSRRIAFLESRNDSLAMANQKLEARLNRQTNNNNSNKALADSIFTLQQRIDFLTKAENENQQLKSELLNKENLLRQNMSAIQLLEKEKNTLGTDLNREIELNQDLESKLELSVNMLADLRTESQDLIFQMQNAQKKIAGLEAQVKTLEGKVNITSAGSKALNDSISSLRAQVSRQKQVIALAESEVKEQERKTDSLASALMRGSIRETLLTMKIDSLEFLNDSLRTRIAPPSEQQRFIREQWEKLEKWDRELKQKETTLSEREKLAAQRESYLQKKEDNIAKRESQLGVIGEKVKAPEVNQPDNSGDQAEGTFKIEKAEEFQQEVPLFCLYTTDAVSAAQKKVAGWFSEQGFFYKKFTPDFLFENILISEIGVEPMHIRVRLDAEAGGTVYRISFRKADYKFIEGGVSLSTDIKIEKILRSIAAWKP